ncbi:hypothetical protein COB18_03700 [Candidatus Kaiserbacteria bacterium]|nr:MAG: hypothetical protein COB18_03700 [Candidatus Kaiserbacteria bacterium]
MKEDKNDAIKKRFAELPAIVQQAITDASIETKLRALAETHKLHLDQWVLLENQIMLTLIGLEDPKNMAKNIAAKVGVSDEIAKKLVADIAAQVFQPIRKMMQHADVPDPTKKEEPTEVAPTEKMTPSDTSAYKTGESSTERRDVQEDPYRESIE